MKRWLCAAALLAGCAVGPNYHRPPLDVPAEYRDVDPSRYRCAPATRHHWATAVGGRCIRTLTFRSFSRRRSRTTTTSRSPRRGSRRRRAELGSTRLNYLPQVSVNAGAERAKISDYALTPGASRINNEAQVQILASYQIDLWGQLRRMNEASRANLLASRFAARAVNVTVVATVANAYFNLISLDSQLEITRRTVVTREKFVELTHAQHERGYATGLDVATAEAQLAAARATVPDLERQIAQTEDQISVLIGSNPEPITRAHYGEAVPQAPPRPPAGLPAQLLERRPDVAQAEQGLVAANAEVGVAKAALFPNISLTGSTGSLSVPFGNLFTPPAAEWGLGVSLLQPLLSVQSNLYQVGSCRRAQARGDICLPSNRSGSLRGRGRCARRLSEVRGAGARAGAPSRCPTARAGNCPRAVQNRLCLLL